MSRFFFDVEGEQILSDRVGSSIRGSETAGQDTKGLVDVLTGVSGLDEKSEEYPSSIEREATGDVAARNRE